MAVSNLTSSSHCEHNSFPLSLDNIPASVNNRIQYLDSLASLEAIAILAVKSFFDCPAVASSTLAPMLVADRSNWPVNSYSLDLDLSPLTSWTTANANA